MPYKQVRQILLLPIFALILLFGHAQAARAADRSGILTPGSNSVLQGIVPVEGIAQHSTFRKWQLDLLIHYDEDQAHFVALGEKTHPQPGWLTNLDTTQYPNGKHLLRLRVVYQGLNYDEYFVPIFIDNAGAPPAVADEADPVVEEIPAPTIGPLGQGVPEGRRWIEVDISDQSLTAWQGETAVLKTTVSTGKPGWQTLPGTFKVYVKYDETRMTGIDYDTPDVPWTMYYYQGFAIHGAYWHNNFGTPVSHGCVNLRVDEAKALYEWSSVGTEVVVNE